MQKQALEMDLSENSAALREVSKSKDSVYKIIGQLMIKIDRDTTIKELSEKEKLIKSRLEIIKKQEREMNDKLLEIKEELMGAKSSKTVAK